MLTSVSWRKLGTATLAKLGLGRRGKQRTGRSAAQGARRGRPFLEALEDRTLLSVFYWDPMHTGNSQKNPSGSGGTGTWDTTSNNWFNGTTDVSWPNSSNGDTAVFSGTSFSSGGTVTLGTDIKAGALTFNSNGYTVTGKKTLSLVELDNRLGVAQGITATISANISGLGFSKTGMGTLTLSGANTWATFTAVSGGTLRLGAANALPSSAAVTLDNVPGATLDVNNFKTSIARLNGGGAKGGNVTLGSGTLTVGEGSFSGVISGTAKVQGAGLTMVGPGTLTLAGANTYPGPTLVKGGTLKLGAKNALFKNTEVTLEQATTLDLGNYTVSIAALSGKGKVTLGSGALSVGLGLFNGVISGAGDLIKTGDQTLTLGGANNYMGMTTITGGTLQLGANNALPSGTTVTLFAAGTLNLNNKNATIASLTGKGGNVVLGSGTLTLGSGAFSGAINLGSGTLKVGSGVFNGVISGKGNLIKVDGPAPVQLGGTNTYTGTTTINAGTLYPTAPGALGPAGDILITPLAGKTAILELGSLTGLTNTTGAIKFDSSAASSSTQLNTNRQITLPNAISLTGSLNNINVAANTVTLTGNITGKGNLHLIGNGKVMVTSQKNDYSGKTIIKAAGKGDPVTLQAGAEDAFSPYSAVILDDVAGDILDLNGFDNTIASLAGGGALGGDVTLGSGTLTIDETASDLFSGNISGAGGVTLAGTGILELAGDDTYTGATTINEGVFQLEAGDDLPSGTVVTVAAGATLDLNNQNATLAGLAGQGNVTLGSGTLTIDGAGGSFSGVISGTGGVIMAGTGIQSLSGANTYTGATIINAGTLQLGADNALPSGCAVVLANAATAILDLNSFNATIASLAGGGATGGNVTLGRGTLTIANAIDGSSSSYAGSIGGTGGLIIDLTGASPVQGLSGANTYTGTTTIYAGTLAATAAGALGPAGGGNILLLPSASNLAILDLSTLASLTNTNGVLSFDSSADSSTAQLNTGAAITLSNAITLTGSANIFNVVANTTQLGGAITGTGGLTELGSGILQLSGTSNTYSGATTISAGTLQEGAANALSSGSAVTVAAAATLDLNHLDATIGSLAGAGNVINGGNLTAGGDNTSTTFSGVIRQGSFTKAGTGTLTLSGLNTYFLGTTVINAGTLQLGVANALPENTDVTVAAGATLDLNDNNVTIGSLTGAGDVALGSGNLTLGGNNTSTTFSGSISGTGALIQAGTGTLILTGADNIVGAVTISAGGLTIAGGGIVIVEGDFINQGSVTLQASGAGAGILEVAGDYTQGTGATLTVQLGGAPASGLYDELVVIGTANLAGTLTVQLVNGYTPSPGDSFSILPNDSVNGNFGTTNLAGGTWDLNAGTVTF
jgi:autotransporter-associated beta strand protein